MDQTLNPALRFPCSAISVAPKGNRSSRRVAAFVMGKAEEPLPGHEAFGEAWNMVVVDAAWC